MIECRNACPHCLASNFTERQLLVHLLLMVIEDVIVLVNCVIVPCLITVSTNHLPCLSVMMISFSNIISFLVLSQILTELKSDNQRLKDENGALIRVISKLSKWKDVWSSCSVCVDAPTPRYGSLTIHRVPSCDSSLSYGDGCSAEINSCWNSWRSKELRSFSQISLCVMMELQPFLHD